LPTYEALKLAEEQNLDLVEVSPRAVPPVCRIMDFGKFKYEESKKEKASRRHQSTVVIKEIKLRPRPTSTIWPSSSSTIHRFWARQQVQAGDRFRGREIVHPETGQAMLDQVVKGCLDIAAVEQKPIMEGRRMVMMIGPRAGVIRPASASGAAAPSSGPGDQEGGSKPSEAQRRRLPGRVSGRPWPSETVGLAVIAAAYWQSLARLLHCPPRRIYSAPPCPSSR